MNLAPRTLVLLALLVFLAAVPAAAAAFNQPFYVDLFRRIMIFAIAAISLNLILGYGGMVSFGHAAYLGIGAYAVGVLAHHGIDNGYLQWSLAIFASALAALVIGAVSLRTTGIYFIMITLAFTQMLYYLGVSIEEYGGDDGMRLTERSQFSGLIDLNDGAEQLRVAERPQCQQRPAVTAAGDREQQLRKRHDAEGHGPGRAQVLFVCALNVGLRIGLCRA